MGWCGNCQERPISRDPDYNYVCSRCSRCCTLCGRILDQESYCSRATFAKDSSGQSRQTGNIIKILQHEFSSSKLRILEKGIYVISYLVNDLVINGGDTLINNAHDFYEMAVDKNFTKGRKISHVAAACLYLACRKSKQDDNLLIDFSTYLGINVYVLRAVFLQLCKTLDLLEHPIVQKIVDPSLFIHRFTKRKKNDTISEMALNLIARMKRDCMQTERKPNEVCGAALYISVHCHGFNYSKSDIASAVHICEATLNRRLIEFEDNDFCNLINERSCDVNMTPYVGCTEGKESKEPGSGSADSVGRESIDTSTFSEQHGFADSEDDGSDHLSFSDIDDAGERKQKLVEEAKNTTPAQTLEATGQMLKRKTFSPKINYEALETLFASEQGVKKQKVESDADDLHETPEMKDDHVDDPDNKDGDGLRASENDGDGEDGDEEEDEDYDYDYDYDYRNEDYDFEDDF